MSERRAKNRHNRAKFFNLRGKSGLRNRARRKNAAKKTSGAVRLKSLKLLAGAAGIEPATL
jgi:hypothetical protein